MTRAGRMPSTRNTGAMWQARVSPLASEENVIAGEQDEHTVAESDGESSQHPEVPRALAIIAPGDKRGPFNAWRPEVSQRGDAESDVLCTYTSDAPARGWHCRRPSRTGASKDCRQLRVRRRRR